MVKKKKKVEIIEPIQTKITDWYDKLLDDLWELAQTKMIEFKHQIGLRIIEDWDKFGKPEYGNMFIETLAKDLQISSRDLYRCIQFARTFPTLKLLEEHLNNMNSVTRDKISWRWIVNELLPENKDIKPETPELPAGKYNVIYADPPWDIGSIELEKWSSPLKDKYTTMDLESIKKLDIPKLSNDDCSLFLWATHTTLKDALEVMESWGFKYHCCITWDKGNGWSANGFHRRTEFCLYGYKGNINVNQEGEFIPTLIFEKKRKHSQKPKIMRDLIISNSPKPRIELFAREKLDNEFDVWGVEINGIN